ncbi:helix-turn-helix domain-containing protein, partial [bacterium]|nr:helix-turn-helix domain-containing protein [bacterium]
MNTVSAQNSTNNAPQYKQLLSVSEAAKLLKVSPSSLRRLESSGKIKSIRKPNGYRVFRRIDIIKLGETLQKKTTTTKTSYLIKRAEKKLKRDTKTTKVKTQIHAAKKEGYQIARTKYDSLAKKRTRSGLESLKYAAVAMSFIVMSLVGTAIYIGRDGFTADFDKLGILSFFAPDGKPVVKDNVLSEKMAQVLGTRDRETDYQFSITVPALFQDDVSLGQNLSVTGTSTLSGGVTTSNLTFADGVGGINNLQTIDTVTETTLEEELEVDGDVTGPLNDTALADTIEYSGDWDFAGTWGIEGTEVSATADQINLFSDVTATATEINYLDGTTVTTGGVLFGDGTKITQDVTNFYWDDTNNRLGIGTNSPSSSLSVGANNDFAVDSSGNVTLVDATLVNLSAIAHDDATSQGLKLPQGTSLTPIVGGGAGYIAYDTTNNKVKTFNGTAWTDISGASTTLQEAYEAGNNIAMTASEGDIRIHNDSGSNFEILFLDESTGYVGIGNTSPSYKLDVNGDIRIASGSDLYVGSIGLNDTAGATTSGAYLIGTYDEFTYSSSTNVQDVLDDLDAALAGTGSGTTYWNRVGTILSPTTPGDTLQVGTGTVGAPSYAFESDADTGMSLPTVGMLTFGTGGSDRMAIDSSGNVGIGTTAPGYKLEVNGTLQADDYYSGDGTQGGTSSPGGLVFKDGLYVSGTPTGGGIGNYWQKVGTILSPTTPGDTLQVGTGTVGAPSYAFESDADTGMSLPTVGMLTFGTGGSDRMAIDSSGNVGIGTTAPGGLLNVEGTLTATTGVNYQTYNDVTYSPSGTTSSANIRGLYNTISITGAQDMSSSDIYGIYNNVDNTSTDEIGNLYGIYSTASNTFNTATANNIYGVYSTVAGDDNTDTGYGIYTTVAQSGMGNPIETGYGLYIGGISGTTSYGIYQAVSNNKNYFAGNVGIGTTGPGYKLDVSGDIRIATGSELYSSGSATLGNRTYTNDNYVTDAQTFTASIDVLDTNLGNLAGGTHAAVTLNTSSYDYLSLSGQEITLGPIVLTTDVSGILPVGNGGTGTSTQFVPGSLVFAGASGVYTQDAPNLFWVDGSDYLGIGTSNPSYTLDVNGDIRIASGSDLYIGTVGIGDTGGGASTAGAYLVGTYDEFANSSSWN